MPSPVITCARKSIRSQVRLKGQPHWALLTETLAPARESRSGYGDGPAMTKRQRGSAGRLVGAGRDGSRRSRLNCRCDLPRDAEPTALILPASQPKPWSAPRWPASDQAIPWAGSSWGSVHWRGSCASRSVNHGTGRTRQPDELPWWGHHPRLGSRRGPGTRLCSC